jgi:periplasmic protein TonB
MRVEPVETKRSRIFRIGLAVSLAAHIVLAGAILGAMSRKPKTAAITVTIVHEVRKPEPPKPPPPPEKPKPIKPSKIPPPNQDVPPPKQPQEPPKPVFGVTEDSVTQGDSGMSVRVGNTLMKEPEKKLTDPNQVKPYSGSRDYEAYELDRPPRPVKTIDPEYPTMARRTGKVGRVVLRILITKTGQVAQVKVIQGPGTGLGFEEAAVAAVKQWRFSPPTVHGTPVDVWADLPIRFTLD